MDIFIGSLPFKLKENQLREIFEKFGEVSAVKIILNKITRQNKGYGFISMVNDEEALKAIKALDGTEVDGRIIEVEKSEPEKKIPKKPPFRLGKNQWENKESAGKYRAKKDKENKDRRSK